MRSARKRCPRSLTLEKADLTSITSAHISSTKELTLPAAAAARRRPPGIGNAADAAASLIRRILTHSGAKSVILNYGRR